MRRIIHWTPRVLAVAFALFLALFALDVFDEFDTIIETLVALFMHLIPTFLLLMATAVAWRWARIGGVIFILLGCVSVVFFGTYEHIFSFLLVSAPALIVGTLFLLDDRQQKLTISHDRAGNASAL